MKQKRTKYIYLVQQGYNISSFKSFKLAIRAIEKEVKADNKVEIFRVERT